MLKRILQSGFLTALAIVLTLGFTAISEPAHAAPGRNFCPTTDCPANLVGWTDAGTCLNYGPHGCIEECALWRNNSTGSYCTDLDFCAFQ
jgi:hypothetical protein